MTVSETNASLAIIPAERLEVMGSVITLRATSDATDGACMTFDLQAPPGVGVPMHVHDHEDELFIIRSGRVRFEVDGSTIVASAGESVFAPRHLPHSWVAVGEEMLDAIVTILPGRLDAMFRDLGAMPPGPPDLERVLAICAPHGIRFA